MVKQSVTKNKNWIIFFLAVYCIYIVVVTGTNFIVDPYWYFDYKNHFNTHESAFNERQQKSNHIRNTSKNYDSILIGSSRTSYIDQKVFSFANVYNFSVSSMRPIEYKSYIDFFKSEMQNPPKYIIIGMDFAGSNRNRPLFDSTPPQYYFDNSKFSVAKFMSYDLMKKSIYNIRFRYMDHFDDAHAYYDRDNVKHMVLNTENLIHHEQLLANDIHRFEKDVYGKKYAYDSNLSIILHQLKRDNQETKIIIFTTPVSKPLFDVMLKQGRLPDYERWLRALVDNFGNVWHFMDINSITENDYKYFADGHHASPFVANMIAAKISNTSNIKVPSDFGVLLTKDNIDQYLISIRKKL